MPPYGGFISQANAQNKGQDRKAQQELVDKRAGVLIDKKNAKFTIDELIEDINHGKNNGQLKKLLGTRVSAKRLLYRALTPFEQKLVVADPDSPIGKLDQYVIVEYADNKGREDAIEPAKKEKSFLHVTRDALMESSVLPSESNTGPAWLGAAPTVNNQWGMHQLNFPGAWDKTLGRAWITALDNGVWEASPDLSTSYRKHLSFNAFSLANFDRVDESAPWLTDFNGNISAGHGTHVASIMAGTHNNGGTAGGCPSCLSLRYASSAARWTTRVRWPGQ